MRTLTPLLLGAVLLAASCAHSASDSAKTTFQTAGPWRPIVDTRADAVMVYGTGGSEASLQERLDSWRERGYVTHFMTGIAWGGYGDYFTGEWDGRTHWDEGQVEASGDTIWHGKNVPYIVPTENYLAYFKERHIKPVIDAGVNDIFLEEPEFWARAGYSEAFRREWEAFYGIPWQDQASSPEAAWRSAKLKYHLYYRALDECFTYAKEYGRSLGRKIRCYVPTHSLINYSQWQIVSPEASLASLPCVDGYIAQVWTGTSRVPNLYGGRLRSRVFETAFLEYGCMLSMTAPTGRRIWLLTDPIEDARRDWEDYRRNYQATYVAQLLYPQVADYEIMPWPDRIYGGLYPVREGSDERQRIPADFASMMQVMLHALQEMPRGEAPLSRVSVLMSNSLMFQGDTQLSDFFGFAMPILKGGERVGITHIENLGYPDALRGVEVLLMTYANMKPLSPEAHEHLAAWVRGGGKLLYCGSDSDPFQTVPEWWNSGAEAYATPSGHLFTRLGLAADAADGLYDCGKGRVRILRCDPSGFVQAEGGERTLLSALEELVGQRLRDIGYLYEQRGPYHIVAVMDEGSATASPYTMNGLFVDLFDPELPVYTSKLIQAGEQGFFYEIDKAGKAPKIIATGGRSYQERREGRSFRCLVKGPAETVNVTRVLLPGQPVTITVNGSPYPFDWDEASRTCRLRFPNSPDGVAIRIRW